MANESTVDEALKELRRLMPGAFATVAVHQHGDMNRPDNILKTINNAEIYIEGGYWFRASTLSEAMADVRKWKQEQS